MSEVTTNGVYYDNYGETIRLYNAVDFTKPLDAITQNGVCGTEELSVSFVSNTFTVAPGRCFINGFFREFTETHSFTMVPNHNGYIIAELDASPNVRRITIKMLSQEGAYPELIQNSITYQMPLAEFSVGNSMISGFEDIRSFSAETTGGILNIRYDAPDFNDFMQGYLWKHTPTFNPMYREITIGGFYSSSCAAITSTGDVIFPMWTTTANRFIGIYNPYTRTYTTGPTITGAYSKSVVTPDGNTVLFLASSQVAIYNPYAKTISYGPMLDRNVAAAVLAPTGEVILASSTIAIYNYVAKTISNGPATGTTFTDAVLLPTSEVLLLSNSAGPLVLYNPATKTVTEGPVIGSDYNYAVLTPAGTVALISATYSNIYPILIYNPRTKIITEGPLSSESFFPITVLAPSGKILLSSYINGLYEFEVNTNTLKQISGAIASSNYNLMHGALAPTGELVFPPTNGQDKIGILNLMGDSIPMSYCVHPYLNN